MINFYTRVSLQKGASSLAPMLLTLTLVVIFFAISIPGYRIYTVRSAMKSHLEVLNKAKDVAADFYAENKRMPCSSFSPKCNAIDNGFENQLWQQENIQISFHSQQPKEAMYGSAAAERIGAIEGVIAEEVVPGKAEVILAYLPKVSEAGDLSWQCVTTKRGNATSIPVRYLPEECVVP